MTSKIDTLGKALVAKHASQFDNGYSSAYGSVRSLAEMMLADLPADKRAFYERVIDGLIAENS
jgi:hypothetical protein